MHLDEEPIVITTNIQTNQNGRKDTWGSNRSRPDPLDIHEGRAEDGNDYAYRTPNRLEHGNQNKREDHGRCPPQPQPTPSGMTPEPLPYPDPSEASERSSLPPTSLLSPLKKDNIKPAALSMYTESPTLSWNLDLVPAKKNGVVEPAEESEMREGIGLMTEGASPFQEFGGGTGSATGRPDRMDSEAESPLLAIASAC